MQTNFARYRRCKRLGTVQTPEGMVCAQHSPKARAARAEKREKIGEKKRRLYYARLHAKQVLKKT